MKKFIAWWEKNNDFMLNVLLVGMACAIVCYSIYIWWVCPD